MSIAFKICCLGVLFFAMGYIFIRYRLLPTASTKALLEGKAKLHVGDYVELFLLIVGALAAIGGFVWGIIIM